MEIPCKWREVGGKPLADCRIFTLTESDRETCDGRKRGAFFLMNAPDWAGVIPVVDTPEGRSFVMIRQFRHGTGRVSVEFPGGAIDPGEDPRQGRGERASRGNRIQGGNDPFRSAISHPIRHS